MNDTLTHAVIKPMIFFWQMIKQAKIGYISEILLEKRSFVCYQK